MQQEGNVHSATSNEKTHPTKSKKSSVIKSVGSLIDDDGRASVNSTHRYQQEHMDEKIQEANRLMEMVHHETKSIGSVSIQFEEEQDEELGEEESGTSHTVGSYVQQKDLEDEPDFFDILGEIPSVASISLDPSILEIAFVPPSKVEDKKIDKGRFVDPLTGQVIVSAESLESARESHESIQLEAMDEEEGEEEEIIEDEDFELPSMTEVEEEKPVKKEDDGLDLWYSMEAPQIKRDTEIDFEETVRQAEIQAMLELSKNFLNDLINTIVERCEYIDPSTILRQNLDKRRLVRELQEKLSDLDVEQKARFFLNRKTVEYFRRKKAFRALLEDAPETITQIIEKYKEATTTLDQLLGREEETKNAVNLRTENLEVEMRRKEEEAKENVLAFEDLVRKTLARDNFDKLKGLIENQLQKMAKLRAEISKIRLVLIQRQHTLASLIEKSNALDNLGEGLHMQDFEHLQTETQALGKKIEERNSDLNKLRTRCNADLHIMAHLKEKQQMMRTTISIQESALEELIEEKQMCRESLYNLKVERGKIRNEIRDLSFQGGLIDKPALMLDYDETMERLIKTRAKVEGMRQKHTDLLRRIRELEDSCYAETVEDEIEKSETDAKNKKMK